MDMNKQELAALQVAVIDSSEAKSQLNELELTLVGGGCGDITLG